LLPPIILVIKKRPKGYPTSFTSIGDHIRAKRLTDGLRVIELAKILNTIPENITNWEQGNNTPSTTSICSIIEYLNYCPLLSRPKSLGQLIKLKRFYAGVSSKELARKLSIDQSTILRWENSDQDPKDEKIKEIFELYLNT